MNAFLEAPTARAPFTHRGTPGDLLGHLTNSEMAVFRDILARGNPSNDPRAPHSARPPPTPRSPARSGAPPSAPRSPASPAGGGGSPALSDLFPGAPRGSAYFSGTRYTSTGYPVLVPRRPSARGAGSPRSP